MEGNYGVALRRARTQAGLSQRQLAEQVGVERSHISLIEGGQIKLPNPALRRKIALALGGEPEPVGEAPLSGSRARLADAIRDLNEEEAAQILGLVDLLTRHGRGTDGRESAGGDSTTGTTAHGAR
ncbi:MAG: helix-turn-helix domain-containing protein [Chloroflexota bacterium]|nr:helix-turn-helix domain-containing protein [Chloroflexota bacterium]